MNKSYELVNFCEIDKFATKSYCAVHDVSLDKNLGDITKVDETKIPYFNCIFGGSPCQDFSLAGRQNGSKWKCLDCGQEYNPITVHHSKRANCPFCGGADLIKPGHPCLLNGCV
jgi:DNA (cytosine-5)-methyltransferase 1